MIHYLKITFIIAFLFGSCSSSYQGSSPTATTLKGISTAALNPPTVLPKPTPTLIPARQNKCLMVEKTSSTDFMLDGTIIWGNLADQRIYTLSSTDENPQLLLGKDPSWNPNYRLSPDGKWLAYSILSDDGLRYTTLRIRSLNGDDVWEIPYQEDWSDVSGWINNEQIEMTKSDTDISTTNPYTGTFAINPFTKETSVDIDMANLNVKPATIPYYDPTMKKVIYLRDDLVPESGEPLFESIVIAEVGSDKEIWAKEYPGRDLFLAGWSADGKKVAVQDSSELIVVATDDNQSRILRRDNLEFNPTTFPVWSPDGRYVATKTYDSLAIYDPVKDLLTDFCLHDQILSFSWSPNSHQLAVGGWLPDDSSYTLVIDVETKVAFEYIGTDFVLLGWAKPNDR